MLELRIAFDNGRNRRFYRLLQQRMGIKMKTFVAGIIGYNDALFDENNKEIYDDDQKRERWYKYFQGLLNVEVSINDDIDNYLPQQSPEATNYDEMFTPVEVWEALVKCSCGKALGIDGMPIECCRIMLNKTT